MRVVEVAGLVILEDLVGLADGFESDFGFRAVGLGDFVRVAG